MNFQTRFRTELSSYGREASGWECYTDVTIKLEVTR